MINLLAGVCVVAILTCVPAGVRAAEDIVIADFEGGNYGGWEATGNAFGVAPAKGTLANQRPVGGFKGKGLVNSYLNGDKSTGTLTSPVFTIARDYITFLIGGGGHAETCMQLLVDEKFLIGYGGHADTVQAAVHEKVVAAAVGRNSEQLRPSYFDVKKFKGKTARLRIIDKVTGGWGHISIDHIVLSDTKPKVPPAPGPPKLQSKAMTLDKTYILFPIRNGARRCRVSLTLGEKKVREFDAELAESPELVSFWAFLDITAFAGKTATLTANGATDEGFALLTQSDTIPGAEKFYTEPLRPQFHFSQKVGWNNDPNGMVYYDGEWHLYFQHNPYGWRWGNMHWGHAVSTDLVHWKQLPIAIYNYRHGDWAYSGGAMVDHDNTGGFQTGKEKVIVASYTSTGRGECIAYSNDRGRTFTEYEGNPVVKHSGRDPKIIWYAPGKHWVMAVFDQSREAGRGIAFYASTDLKAWKLQSRLKGYYECAEVFELPVDGDARNTRWVVFAADARYAVGKFDGKTFTPDHEGKHRVHYGNYYASQLFSNPPDGRRIQIGWARITMPGMPFNQMMGFPTTLTLRTTPDGVRMFAKPVKELALLHGKKHALEARSLPDGKPVGVNVAGRLFDIRATFDVGTATSLGIDIAGRKVTFDTAKNTLDGAAMAPIDGRITMQILIDRPSIEICGNDGRVYITKPFPAKDDISRIEAFSTGGAAKLLAFEIYELKSAWKK